MTWEEYQKVNPWNILELNNSNKEKTDIICPKCGKPVYVRTDIIKTSYPPKRQYECDCGWVDYSY